MNENGAHPHGTIHACPPESSGLTPCCHMTPFELPRWDRITTYPELVTCRAEANEEKT